MLLNSLKRKNPANPKLNKVAMRNSFRDAFAVTKLSITFLIMSVDNGSFLLIGYSQALFALSTMFLQHESWSGLNPSSSTNPWNHFSAAYTMVKADPERCRCVDRWDKYTATAAENNDKRGTILFRLDHFKNFIISVKYLLAVDSAVDANNKLTIAFNLGLRCNGRESQAVLDNKICKKK